MNKYKLNSILIDRICSRILGNTTSRLNDDYLVMLELIRLVKGEVYYHNEILSKLPLTKIKN
jgi:hypothetical protein